MRDNLIGGNRIEIRGSGFSVKDTRPKPAAHNPRTGEVIYVPAHRKTHFKPAACSEALHQVRQDDGPRGPGARRHSLTTLHSGCWRVCWVRNQTIARWRPLVHLGAVEGLRELQIRYGPQVVLVEAGTPSGWRRWVWRCSSATRLPPANHHLADHLDLPSPQVSWYTAIHHWAWCAPAARLAQTSTSAFSAPAREYSLRGRRPPAPNGGPRPSPSIASRPDGGTCLLWALILDPSRGNADPANWRYARRPETYASTQYIPRPPSARCDSWSPAIRPYAVGHLYAGPEAGYYLSAPTTTPSGRAARRLGLAHRPGAWRRRQCQRRGPGLECPGHGRTVLPGPSPSWLSGGTGFVGQRAYASQAVGATSASWGAQLRHDRFNDLSQRPNWSGGLALAGTGTPGNRRTTSAGGRAEDEFAGSATTPPSGRGVSTRSWASRTTCLPTRRPTG